MLQECDSIISGSKQTGLPTIFSELPFTHASHFSTQTMQVNNLLCFMRLFHKYRNTPFHAKIYILYHGTNMCFFLYVWISLSKICKWWECISPPPPEFNNTCSNNNKNWKNTVIYKYFLFRAFVVSIVSKVLFCEI